MKHLRLVALSVLVLACGGSDDPGSAPTGGGGAGGSASAGASGASSGAAGTSSSGSAGTSSGAAGTSSGAAGTSSGAAGASSGAAGTGGAVTTTVRVHYTLPAGKTLALRGDHGALSWSSGKPLAAAGKDTYDYVATDLDALTEVKPLLDDQTWSRGPNYKVVPGKVNDLYPHFTQTSGKLVTFSDAFASSKLPDARKVWVYEPPTYVENGAFRAPVVYMHDGNNLFGLPGGFGDWKADDAMDAAAEDGSAREALIVGIGNTPARIDEYTPTYDASESAGGKGDLYLSIVRDELKPMIDGAFRTLPGREDTVMVGSSLGGLISAYAGTKHADVFGVVGAMSPSTWWDGKVLIGMVQGSKAPAGRPVRVYVDSGDAGASMDGVTDTNALAATYLGLGYAEGKDFHHVVDPGGQHNEASWAKRLPGALAFLLGPGR